MSIDSLTDARSSNLTFGAWASSFIALAREAARRAGQAIARRPAIVVVSVLIAFHLSGLTQPLLGHFSTKQTVYGAIARNWARDAAPMFLPTLDELRGDGRSYHLLEWPLTAWLAGQSWAAFGGDLGVWGRAWSVAWTLAALLLFHDWLRRRFDDRVALGGTLALGFAPVLLIYGHAFQTEASLLALTIGSVWTFDRWRESRRLGWLLACGASASLMLVTKIYLAVLIVPLIGWLLEAPTLERASRESASVRSAARDPKLWLTMIVACIPAALWYGFAYFASTGRAGVDPARLYYTVRDSASVHAFPHPLLTDGAFYKRALDVFFGVGLTPIGATLCLWGALLPRAKPLRLWLLATALLLVILPRKFYDMDYYWVALLPALAAAAGVGWAHATKGAPAPAMAGLALVWLAMGLRFGVPPAFTIPPEDRAVIAAGRAVQAATADDARIVSLHGACPDLLYYCDRAGWIWPVDRQTDERNDVELARSRLADYAERGATLLAIADLKQLEALPGLAAAVAERPVLAGGEREDFLLVDLRDDRSGR